MMVSDFDKQRLLLIGTQTADDRGLVSPTSIMSGETNHMTPAHRHLNRHSISTQQMHESKFVGFGEGSSWGEFLRPQGLTSNGPTVYCSDSRNNRIACWNKTTQTFNYINKDVVELDRPAGLATIDDYIVIVDFGNNRVHICQRVMQLNGWTWRRILTFGAEGTEAGNFCRPWGVAVARYSSITSVSDASSNSDQETGTTSTSLSDNFNNNWSNPVGVEKILNPAVGSNKWSTPAHSTYLIGIADRSNNRIQLFKFDASRPTITFLCMFGDGPGARHGQFDRPAGIVFNTKLEQIVVTDKDNHRVQVFDLSGNYLFKFGERGNKCGQFCYPWDIDVCKTTHNILVSDTRNRRVQLFNNLGRYITHFNQPLDSPRGVTFLSPTQMMVSDFNKQRLLLISTQTADDWGLVSSTSIMSGDTNYMTPAHRHLNRHSISTQQMHESKFVGFGEGSSWGEFLRPQGLTSNGPTVYCSDSRNNRIACWNKTTQTFNYINKDVVELDRPAGLATIDDYIVIVDFGNNRVHICQRVMQLNGWTWRRILTFGAEGTEAGNFCRPWGVAIAQYSSLYNVSDPLSHNHQETSTTSASLSDTFNNNWSRSIGTAFSDNQYDDKFLNPAVGSNKWSTPANSTYLIGIADRSNNRIQLFKFDAARQTVSFSHMFGEGPGARHGQFDRPAGIVFDTKLEQIIVTDKDNHRVQVFDLSGNYLFKFGERGNKVGQFCYPWDIDVCKTTHNILVSDTRNRRVQLFNNLGRYITHFNQPLDSPRGVTFLSPTQMMVSDFNKQRLLLISTQTADDWGLVSSTSFK